MGSLDCFRCGELGHFAAACPLLNLSASSDEHMGRIGFYVDRWVGGFMSREQKRVAISMENQLWYGEANCPRSLRYP